MEALRLASTLEMSHDDWLKTRKCGLGGSDIAAIAGLNPWKSPLAVYLDKLGELPEQEDNERMYWGRVLEDVLAQEFKRRNGLRIQRVNAVLQHPEHPMLLANIDRKVFNKKKGNGILEIKTTSAWMAKEWEEGVPDWVMVQLQHYLGVTGLEYGYVAALVGGNTYLQFEVPRDDEVVGYLQQIALDFWKLVESRTPPEMDGSDASTEVLKKLYPCSEPDSIIDLPPTALELIEQFEAAQGNEKVAKANKNEAANRLKAMMQKSEVGLIDGKKVTWKTVVSTRIDSKKLKEERQDIYKKYSYESVSRRFSVK